MKSYNFVGNFAHSQGVEREFEETRRLFHRTMSPRFLSYFLLGSAISLPNLARAAEIPPPEKPFGVAAPDESVRPISQREFADAATKQINFLSELRAWRNTLRGSGPRRDWGVLPVGNEKLSLSLGNVTPTNLGGGAGVAAKWSRLEIGSTSQPEAVDEALARFDSLLTGEKAQKLKARNPTQFNWLRAQLSSSPRAQIEVTAALAERGGVVTGQKWRSGEFGSATARFQLPVKWSLSGDFSHAQVERAGKEDAASSWGLSAAGPVAHPFGVATARVNWRDVGDGYVAPTGENGALGAENGNLELAQDIKIGPLSGQVNFGAATRRREGETVRAGEELGEDRAQSAAQMRLALTPNLSLTGKGQWNTSAATRALINSTENEAEPEDFVTPAEARELSRQLVGDFGVQWNFSKALSLAVSLGASSQDSRSEIGDNLIFGPQSEEMRRALELRQKSGANDFRVRFSQRARKTASATANLNQNAQPISQWRIEAARRLLGSVRLKTILDFASDAATDQSARRIEAQLQLARAARLDARYREGNLAPGLMSDEWSSVFAASNSPSKQWTARFGAGSAAAGAGLGLALEMTRNQGSLPDSYRVGLQFK